MNNVLDIFACNNLLVQRGESHTTGERQIRISIDGSSLRMPAKVAAEMAKEILHWSAEPSGGGEGSK